MFNYLLLALLALALLLLLTRMSIPPPENGEGERVRLPDDGGHGIDGRPRQQPAPQSADTMTQPGQLRRVWEEIGWLLVLALLLFSLTCCAGVFWTLLDMTQ